MKKFNSSKLILVFIFLILIGVISLSFTTKWSQQQNQLDFSGTNSLNISYEDNNLTFNWITNKADIGYYELLDKENTIISKGETESNRVHTISIDYEIKNNVTFKFGGINTGVHEVKLRPKPNRNKSIFKNVDSIFVVGDIHGRYNKLINLLEKSQIIDSDLNWIAGHANLVFLGDIFDRGDDVTKALWFIYALEEKAKQKGGRVHLVLGNHEIMVMTKDLRYLSRKEASIPIAYKTTYDYLFHPSKSLLGAWLSANPSVLKIDKAIFAHGGIVDLNTNSIDIYNQKVHTYINDPIFLEIMKDYPDSLAYNAQKWHQIKYFFYAETNPFWYRGYVYTDTLQTQLNLMLNKYNSKIHVVGHTPQSEISQKYKGKFITTDLKDGTTQLLLLVRKKNKYSKYKIDSSGEISELK